MLCGWGIFLYVFFLFLETPPKMFFLCVQGLKFQIRSYSLPDHRLHPCNCFRQRVTGVLGLLIRSQTYTMLPHCLLCSWTDYLVLSYSYPGPVPSPDAHSLTLSFALVAEFSSFRLGKPALLWILIPRPSCILVLPSLWFLVYCKPIKPSH